MFMTELEQDLADYRVDVDAATRLLVRSGEESGSIDLDQYGLYVSLSTLLLAAEATCAAIACDASKKGVIV